MSEPKNLVIGYVCHGLVHDVFMQSMMKLATEDQKGRQRIRGFMTADYLYVALARNMVVEKFLATDAGWLLFIDTDVQFEPEQVYALLDYADVEHQIIAGLYFTWIEGQLVPTWLDHDGVNTHTVKELIGGLQPLFACGMGFTLIGRPALLKMREALPDDPTPWFAHDVVPGATSRASEDVTFCRRAAAVGIQTYGAPLTVTHIKSRPLNWDSYRQWNAS